MRLCKFKLGIGFDFYGLTDLLYNFIIKAMDYVEQCAANFCVMRISSFITKKRTKTGCYICRKWQTMVSVFVRKKAAKEIESLDNTCHDRMPFDFKSEKTLIRLIIFFTNVLA